jgi:aminocarboxymuconate-semialdehyde decarboxylase
VLDLHTHVVPPGTPFHERLAGTDPRWARLERAGETGHVVVGGAVFRTVARVAWDLCRRREAFEAEGGTGQLLSAMPELFAPWAPPADALDYARSFNDWLAAELPSHGGFFAGLGIVPLQDPDDAAALLTDIRSAGLVGVEVPARPPTAPLHGPAWADFLDEAERLGLLVFVHSVGGPVVAEFPHPMAANGVVFPASIGVAIGALIATGALANRPDLRILASHGGGSLMTELPRIEFLRGITPQLLEIMPRPALEYARQLWYDPMLFDAQLLRYLASAVGLDRIVLGTDHPFMPSDPTVILDDPMMPSGFARAVRETNPATLLGLLASSNTEKGSGQP